MANNFQVNVYQINQNALPSGASQRIGFPSAGVIIRDSSASATRSLSSGVSVYSIVQTQDGSLYYATETFAALATLVA